jgi:hypothetical protein
MVMAISTTAMVGWEVRELNAACGGRNPAGAMAGWELRVKHTYTGPRHTVDLPNGLTSADELEIEDEEHHPGHHHHRAVHVGHLEKSDANHRAWLTPHVPSH